MWEASVIYSDDRSASMQPYAPATQWLSNNLEIGKTVFLPNSGVFLAIDPTLSNKVESYQDFWKSTHTILRANTTDSEVAKVRQELKNFIHNNTSVKYLVVDWIDPYATKLFTPKQCDAFDNTLFEVKRFSFVTPHAQWHQQMIICGIRNSSK